MVTRRAPALGTQRCKVRLRLPRNTDTAAVRRGGLVGLGVVPEGPGEMPAGLSGRPPSL